MANFDVSTLQIDATASKIGIAQNNLRLTQQTMQESIEGARSAWICSSADSFFGSLASALKDFDRVIAFAGGVKATLEKASGNYTSNEKAEVDIVKQIHGAYS